MSNIHNVLGLPSNQQNPKAVSLEAGLPNLGRVLDDIGHDSASFRHAASRRAAIPKRFKKPPGKKVVIPDSSPISRYLRRTSRRVFRVASQVTGLDQIVREARADLRNPATPIPRQNPFQLVAESLFLEANGLTKMIEDPRLQKALKTLAQNNLPLAIQTIQSEAFRSADRATQISYLIGHLGVGPGKASQILASCEDIPENIRKILRKTKTGGAASRTLPEAQAHIDEIYGRGAYSVKKRLGTGTIGEAHLAIEEFSGTEAVVKTIKKGVSAETMGAERQLVVAIAELTIKDPNSRQYYIGKINSLYEQWLGELNCAHEARAAKSLARGAVKYKVAQAKRVGYSPKTKQAVSLVLEKAEGVSLEKLLRMLKVYRKDPSAYYRRFQNLILAHAWLAEPEKWMAKLPDVYRDACNEQTLLRLSQLGTTFSHGDPHAGNVFIHFSEKKKQLGITYIDTGLTVRRTTQKSIEHLALLGNTICGNANAFAQAIVDSAEVLPEKPKELIVKELAAELNARLFQARVNLTDVGKNGEIVEALLEKMGILVGSQETVFVKAQAQAVMTYLEIARTVGRRSANYLRDSIPDIAHGAATALRNHPSQVLSHAAQTVNHIATSGLKTGLRCALQFLVKR